MDKTTILVEKATRDVLKQLGNKGQSYDNLINWLIRIKTRQVNDRKKIHLIIGLRATNQANYHR
jgi:hypothetical protein